MFETMSCYLQVAWDCAQSAWTYIQSFCVCLWNHKEWLFSGIGVVAITVFLSWLKSFFNRKKRKLAIKTKLTVSFDQIIDGMGNVLHTGPVMPTFSFEITNIGNSDILIKDVSWDLCGKKITYKGFPDSTGLAQVDPLNPKKYQKKLQAGEFIKGEFNIAWFAFDEDLKAQLKPRNKIRLEVQDTLGGKYYSEKKYKYGEFLEWIQSAIDTNKKS